MQSRFVPSGIAAIVIGRTVAAISLWLSLLGIASAQIPTASWVYLERVEDSGPYTTGQASFKITPTSPVDPTTPFASATITASATGNRLSNSSPGQYYGGGYAKVKLTCEFYTQQPSAMLAQFTKKWSNTLFASTSFDGVYSPGASGSASVNAYVSVSGSKIIVTYRAGASAWTHPSFQNDAKAEYSVLGFTRP